MFAPASKMRKPANRRLCARNIHHRPRIRECKPQFPSPFCASAGGAGLGTVSPQIERLVLEEASTARTLRPMDSPTLKERATDAIRYWEPRRLFYNAVLTVIVVCYFAMGYPESKQFLVLDSVLALFLLAVLANVAYCVAYIVDIFAQTSEFRGLWGRYRWVVLIIGTTFAGIITRFCALACSRAIDRRSALSELSYYSIVTPAPYPATYSQRILASLQRHTDRPATRLKRTEE
jgi:hypothetical protein